jgi:hypothetical protein
MRRPTTLWKQTVHPLDQKISQYTLFCTRLHLHNLFILLPYLRFLFHLLHCFLLIFSGHNFKDISTFPTDTLCSMLLSLLDIRMKFCISFCIPLWIPLYHAYSWDSPMHDTRLAAEQSFYFRLWKCASRLIHLYHVYSTSIRRSLMILKWKKKRLEVWIWIEMHSVQYCVTFCFCY